MEEAIQRFVCQRELHHSEEEQLHKHILEFLLSNSNNSNHNNNGTLTSSSESFLQMLIGMDKYLNSSVEMERNRATLLIAQLIGEVKWNWNGTQLHQLIIFFNCRLSDHPSVSPSTVGLSTILRKYRDTLDPKYNDSSDIMNIVIAEFAEQMQRYSQNIRHKLYELILELFTFPSEEKHDSHFARELINCIQNEKDPRCLVLTFKIAASIQLKYKHAFDDNSMVETLFDTIAAYFPITFVPPENDPHQVTTELLIGLLKHAMCGGEAILEYTLPFMIDQLHSDLLEGKEQAVEFLGFILLKYGLLQFKTHNFKRLSETIINDSLIDSNSMFSKSYSNLGLQMFHTCKLCKNEEIARQCVNYFITPFISNMSSQLTMKIGTVSANSCVSFVKALIEKNDCPEILESTIIALLLPGVTQHLNEATQLKDTISDNLNSNLKKLHYMRTIYSDAISTVKYVVHNNEVQKQLIEFIAMSTCFLKFLINYQPEASSCNNPLAGIFDSLSRFLPPFLGRIQIVDKNLLEELVQATVSLLLSGPAEFLGICNIMTYNLGKIARGDIQQVTLSILNGIDQLIYINQRHVNLIQANIEIITSGQTFQDVDIESVEVMIDTLVQIALSTSNENIAQTVISQAIKVLADCFSDPLRNRTTESINSYPVEESKSISVVSSRVSEALSTINTSRGDTNFFLILNSARENSLLSNENQLSAAEELFLRLTWYQNVNGSYLLNVAVLEYVLQNMHQLSQGDNRLISIISVLKWLLIINPLANEDVLMKIDWIFDHTSSLLIEADESTDQSLIHNLICVLSLIANKVPSSLTTVNIPNKMIVLLERLQSSHLKTYIYSDTFLRFMRSLYMKKDVRDHSPYFINTLIMALSSAIIQDLNNYLFAFDMSSHCHILFTENEAALSTTRVLSAATLNYGLFWKQKLWNQLLGLLQSAYYNKKSTNHDLLSLLPLANAILVMGLQQTSSTFFESIDFFVELVICCLTVRKDLLALSSDKTNIIVSAHVETILGTLKQIFTSSIASPKLSKHLNVLIPNILEMATNEVKSFHRASAIKCLVEMSKFPYTAIYPFKKNIDRVLKRCLDDKKQFVRRLAAIARTIFITLGDN